MNKINDDEIKDKIKELSLLHVDDFIFYLKGYNDIPDERFINCIDTFKLWIGGY